MDLTLQDKNELLKAAIRTTDRDIADWLVTIVEQSDALTDGRRNIPCPAYQRNGHPAAAEAPGA